MRILIVGSGLAGLTAAYWFKHFGHQPYLIEKTAAFERKGFLIGFRGSSITVLKQMKLLEATLALSIDSIEHDILNAKGQRLNRSLYLSYKDDERGKLPINRADLHNVLYEAIKETIAIRFGMTIESVSQHSDGINVRFVDGTSEDYDLLIGADGVHSTVRRLVFGDGSEQVLDATYAAFISPKTHPVTSAVQFAKGRMSIIYDLNATEFGGIFLMKGHDFAHVPVAARKATLIAQHGPPIADALHTISDDTFLFVDKLIQIVLPRWFDGRVALVGDAAYALSPASGFGGTAAITGAYILAQEIAHRGLEGLTVYEQRMHSALQKKQKAAASTVKQIVSESPVLQTIRDVLLRLMPEKAMSRARAVEEFGIK